MELPHQGPADAADAAVAADEGPIRMSAQSAEAVDGSALVDDTERIPKGEDAAIAEGFDLEALFAGMENEFGLDAEEMMKLIEVVTEGQCDEEKNVAQATVEGGAGSQQDVTMVQAAQEMDDEYDELFDDAPPEKEPTHPRSPTPQIEPPAPQATPAGVPPPPPDLHPPTVMSNITTIKSAIISNHLLLTRFMHLQSAYRALSSSLATERHLHAQAQSTITRMREELNSLSHDSPLLQFQITQLKDDVRRERASRTQSDATILQYQENIQSLRAQLEQVRKEKAKLESGERKAQEAIKDADGLRGKIVALMSENRRLSARVDELGGQEWVGEQRRMQEEIVKLRERVIVLEGNNIRLKASRSILCGGEGNTLAGLQSMQSSPPRAFAARTAPSASNSPPPPRPPPPIQPQPSRTPKATSPPSQAQNKELIIIPDDEVEFIGTNNLSSTLQNFQIATPTIANPPPLQLSQYQSLSLPRPQQAGSPSPLQYTNSAISQGKGPSPPSQRPPHPPPPPDPALASSNQTTTAQPKQPDDDVIMLEPSAPASASIPDPFIRNPPPQPGDNNVPSPSPATTAPERQPLSQQPPETTANCGR